MSSQERHVKSYVELYGSLGWNSLVCHSEFLNMFFPEKATSLAVHVLNELAQIIDGKCGGQENLDDFRLVRYCISGYIYDSSPVDFTSDLGTRFVLHPTVRTMSHPPRLASWIAHSISSGLDTLFLSRFESQRAEYWQTLYSSISMKAPYLIFCSENDDLAPCEVICYFTQRIQELGGDVKLVKWKESAHVGHFRHYPIEYKAALMELLDKADKVYSLRTLRLDGERMGMEGTRDEIPEPICGDLKKAATKNSNSFREVAIGPSDNYFLPTSMEYGNGKGVGSMQNEHKQGLIHLHSLPSISVHGVLGQMVSDVCIPKNVKDWDLKSSPSNGCWFIPTKKNTSFNPIKCMRRSRL
ncbi:uncharacterized protein LOC122298521 isoform X2 [Carya illinoinensis]|uniref:uncharacterized protein LOC122298521 isoform X2 n=1 Tax=Carya illinoinensis TaxID=32201 RepID=UPI001C7299A8|nr:uncharacterized protein LOC122298521 isoform X2 [Carya illinoinensis]